MKSLMACAAGVLLLAGCAAEKTNGVPVADAGTTTTAATASQTATEPVVPTGTASATTESAAQTATSENQDSGTWAGQIKIAQPVSMFNYVGAESGDFAPMRFRNDSEAGKKILAACRNDDLCEFTGIVEWLDETPPPDASAIGQIIRVESVKRLPAETR